MRDKYIPLTILFVVINIVFSVFIVYNKPTFTQMRQNPDKTMRQYEAYWDDTEIKTEHYVKKEYQDGDTVATLTIPKLNIYGLPIYYGTTDENKNWQLTTPGYEGNWQLFGEYGMAAIGAHNYQLFNQLPTLEENEKIIVETPDDIYVYVVQSSKPYNHETDNWNEFVYNGKSPYSISLLTCYPIDALNTEDRYVVYATMQRGTKFIEE